MIANPPQASKSKGGDDAFASNRASDRGGLRIRSRTGGPGAGAVGAGAGQDDRAQALALGPADAPAAEGDGGLERFGREGVERHDQVQDLPGAAARQGVRPL